MRHTSLAMPWTNGLFAPINKAPSKNITTYKLKESSLLKGAIEDFSTIISAIIFEPMPLAQLIPEFPDMLGKFCALKKGRGQDMVKCYE